jgi:hypothetical protein
MIWKETGMRIDASAWQRLGAAALVVLGCGRVAVAQSSDTPARAVGSVFAQSQQYPLLPRDLEIELALSAAPPHLRESASVLVLDTTGFVPAMRRGNAFTCVVSRRAGDLFPVCWDAEGARTLLPLDVDDATLRLEGKSGADIDHAVTAGFASGRYHPPSRTGIAYMLSPLRYRIDEHGKATRSTPNPHVMFYGPNLTDADIGGLRGSVAFMNKVGPDGMIIVPVGQKEREAIVHDAQSLTERLERAIGFTAER